MSLLKDFPFTTIILVWVLIVIVISVISSRSGELARLEDELKSQKKLIAALKIKTDNLSEDLDFWEQDNRYWRSCITGMKEELFAFKVNHSPNIPPAFLKPIDFGESRYGRVTKVFKENNIKYFWQLISLTEAELRRMPGIGQKSLNEIKEFLKGKELELNTNLEQYFE